MNKFIFSIALLLLGYVYNADAQKTNESLRKEIDVLKMNR